MVIRVEYERFYVHVNLYIIFFTIEKRPVASRPRYVAVATYLGLLATKPQPTNDLLHIQGQNIGFRSNILAVCWGEN